MTQKHRHIENKTSLLKDNNSHLFRKRHLSLPQQKSLYLKTGPLTSHPVAIWALEHRKGELMNSFLLSLCARWERSTVALPKVSTVPGWLPSNLLLLRNEPFPNPLVAVGVFYRAHLLEDPLLCFREGCKFFFLFCSVSSGFFLLFWRGEVARLRCVAAIGWKRMNGRGTKRFSWRRSIA
ncbi:hypothetical protein CEXT_40881 [Caerostris extrusa]|uniref:Uncharacterized protein n=1 Tax=Caerostris extrusa TaxID=172846 RepID=A0AAV4W8Z2_CAEEX|nr:hypothetical protein CEXT_40881 [Caerostris extrusa]